MIARGLSIARKMDLAEIHSAAGRYMKEHDSKPVNAPRQFLAAYVFARGKK
jgi:hypothetical protein